MTPETTEVEQYATRITLREQHASVVSWERRGLCSHYVLSYQRRLQKCDTTLAGPITCHAGRLIFESNLSV